MLLAEAIGPEAFRERVKIYATDVDEDALTQARHAIYDPVPSRMSRLPCSRSTSSGTMTGTPSTGTCGARSSSGVTT